MYFYAFIIAMGTLSRLIPHQWNFAPVTAIAIFSAVYLSKKEAIILPLVIRFISDLILGFFSWPIMVGVYIAHIFGVLMGLWFKQKKSAFRLIAAPVFSALFFFLLTNFAFLYAQYPHNFDGVLLAYSYGLPFLRGTLVGDLFFSVSMIAIGEWVLVPHKKLQSSNA